jgi:hypothetical protein
VYGPVRTVVWQGSVGDHRPYADLVRMRLPILRSVAITPACRKVKLGTSREHPRV